MFDRLNELWWKRLPTRVARASPFLSTALSDGAYLSAWPAIGALVPPAGLLLGFVLGWQTFGSFGGGELFTFSLIGMALLLSVSLLGACVGAMVWFGYVVADLLLYRGLGSLAPRLLGGVIVADVLLGALCVLIPTAASQVTAQMQTLTARAGAARARLDDLIFVAAAGTLAGVWTLATPSLIVGYYRYKSIGSSFSPDLSAMAPLQRTGARLIGVALGVAILRRLLETAALSRPDWKRRADATQAAVAAIAPAGSTPARQIAGIVLRAALITLLLGGMMTKATHAALVVVIVVAIFVAQRAVAGVRPWVSLTGKAPVPVRLAVGGVLSWLVARLTLKSMWAGTGTFFPVIIASLIGLLVISLLVPESASRTPRT